ncbi:MAG: DUF3570 domain-containing protein [Candidatus Eisenbacteria bacterium]|nr:DUF3570 domain-containing protein [Candidatus Eisenbacteria bacterium]
MQQLKWIGTASLAFLATCAAATRCGAQMTAVDDQTAEYLMQLFSDSGHVSVRSAIGNYTLPLPHDRALSLHWNNERVVVPAIKAAPGTQEAVDAITTASRPISGNAFSDYVKVRNEIEGGLKQGRAAVEYYLSSEADYLAQQLGGSYNRDIGGDQLNLSVGTSYGWDRIDPLPDDKNNGVPVSRKNTLHWNAVATQILSPTLLLRYGVEYNIVEGLQHNPYRDVFAGGSRVPERHPDHRQRRDAFVRLNQYLSNRASLKFSYRFYNDDWGIDSHELGSKLSQSIAHGVFASYEYRYYTQTPARFWRADYTSLNGVDGYLTGDYRMGPLSSHLFGAALDVGLDGLAAEHPTIGHFGFRCEYERYFNSNNYSANILTTQVTYAF